MTRLHATTSISITFGALAFALALPSRAELGGPDPTWGHEGILNLVYDCPFSRCEVHVQAVAPAPQGRLLMLVKHTRSIDLGTHYTIGYSAQLRNADGSLNRVLGGMGSVPPDDGGAIEVQPDGKIVFAGLQGVNCAAGGYDCELWLNVARVMPEGQPDTAFGTFGQFLLDVGGKPVSAMRVLADGRIVVVAGAPYRLTATGQVDLAYGNAGKGAAVSGARVLVLPDGRVIAIYATSAGFGLLRIDAQGNPDATFNAGGSREYAVPNADIALGSLSLEGDRILVAANDRGMPYGSLLIRILPDGTLDPGFGTGGMLRTYANGQLSLLASDSHGRIVGVTASTSSTQFVRWAADGTGEEIVGPPTLYPGTQLPGALLLLGNSKAVLTQGPFTTRFGRNAIQSDHEFVLQQYRDFLSREGDAGGVAYWRDRLENGGVSRGALASSFLASPEFQGRVAPVSRLYFAYLLRVPDYAGLLHWVTYADANQLRAVSDAFASSPEFVNRYGSTDNAGFVQLVYQNVLGRAPDLAGQAHWTSQLESGAMTRGQVMLAFSEGEEFRASTGNETLVAITYAGVLRREAEATGFDYWTGYLDGGNSLPAMVGGFLSTPEYRARFAP